MSAFHPFDPGEGGLAWDRSSAFITSPVKSYQIAGASTIRWMAVRLLFCSEHRQRGTSTVSTVRSTLDVHTVHERDGERVGVQAVVYCYLVHTEYPVYALMSHDLPYLPRTTARSIAPGYWHPIKSIGRQGRMRLINSSPRTWLDVTNHPKSPPGRGLTGLSS